MAKQELILSQQQIEDRISELGARISADYTDKNLVMIGVLNGSFIFLADLVRKVSIPHQIDFIRVASYGSSSKSSGKISLSKDVELDLSGRDIVLVEDIVDTGTTLNWLVHYFTRNKVRSVRTCALIDKKERREVDVTVDYVGFTLKKGFLVGYGLDYAERYRHLPQIYSLYFS
jgi:hypoxanthine phosphoribosyltransferase